MATTSTVVVEPCPKPSTLQKKIQDLELDTKTQEQSDAKLKYAELTKISSEIEPVKAKYKQEYESLQFAATQTSKYVEFTESEILKNRVPASERTVIDGFVDCVDKQIIYLQTEWLKARDKVPSLTSAYLTAVNTQLDAEKQYRNALAYKKNQSDLDALQARSLKEIEAKNFRGTYFLVAVDMKNRLKDPVKPDLFNEELEKKSLAYYEALDAARIAKTALDQKTAESDKNKKAYEEAVTKRQDNILKQINEERFPAASTVSAAGAGSTPPAGEAANPT